MCERTEWRTCRDSTKVDIGSLARLILEGAPAREIEDFVASTPCPQILSPSASPLRRHRTRNVCSLRIWPEG